MRKANRSKPGRHDHREIKYFTKLFREQLQYSKASRGTTRFKESANQSYEYPQLRDSEDETTIMFAQMETKHQQHMDILRETMQVANERSMKMAENQMREKK